MKKTFNEQELSNLNQNFKNTNWSNARIENGILLADHFGQIDFPHATSVNGTNTCHIYNISAEVLNQVSNYGADQNGWLKDKFDFQVMGIDDSKAPY